MTIKDITKEESNIVKLIKEIIEDASEDVQGVPLWEYLVMDSGYSYSNDKKVLTEALAINQVRKNCAIVEDLTSTSVTENLGLINGGVLLSIFEESETLKGLANKTVSEVKKEIN